MTENTHSDKHAPVKAEWGSDSKPFTERVREEMEAKGRQPDLRVRAPKKEKHQEPKNFWQRIAPKSKKGRVVFAAGTAQVVSLCLTAVAGHIFKNHRPGFVEEWEKDMVTLFNRRASEYKGEFPDKGPSLLRPDGWKGFLDFEPYQDLKRYDGKEWKANDPKTGKLVQMSIEARNYDKKHMIQARTITEFVAMGLTNILSTIMLRNYFDKKLDINIGGKNVVKTQMIDTVTGIGSMFIVPKIFPKFLRSGRKGIQDLVNKVPVKPGNEAKRDEFGRSLGVSAMNMAVPDFIGFGMGIFATFRELDALEKAREAEEKLQEIEPTRGR